MTNLEPELTADIPALVTFGCATRQDLNPQDLEGALHALTTAGWTWNRTLMATAAMLAHGETPRDLRAALRPTRNHTR